MKLEIISAEPVRDALNEIRAREQEARRAFAPATAEALRVVGDIVEKAIDRAGNPDLSEGVEIEEYARINGITLSAAYKRIQRARKLGNDIAVKVPGGLRVKIAS